MKDIDFLPASYREKSNHRKVTVWRIAVVAVIGGAVLSAALYQQFLLWELDSQIAELEPQYAAAQQRQAALAELNVQLKAAEAHAQLYTYLRHPWPRTQILHAITSPLPNSISFQELRLEREVEQQTRLAAAVTSSETAPESNSDLAHRDLAKLRSSVDSKIVVVSVTGVAQSISDLHAYLQAAKASPLIANAELKSIQGSSNAEDHECQFTAHFAVRPGYGQPGGPTGDVSATEAESMAHRRHAEPTPRTTDRSSTSST